MTQKSNSFRFIVTGIQQASPSSIVFPRAVETPEQRQQYLKDNCPVRITLRPVYGVTESNTAQFSSKTTPQGELKMLLDPKTIEDFTDGDLYEVTIRPISPRSVRHTE